MECIDLDIEELSNKLNKVSNSLNLVSVTPDNIIPKHDTSVLYTSATICRFKRFLLSESPLPHCYVTQWCFRSRTFEQIRSGHTTEWNSVFRQFGTIAPVSNIKIHLKAIGNVISQFAMQRGAELRFNICSKHIDIIDAIIYGGFSYSIDEYMDSYYIHKYGNDRLYGCNANFSIKAGKGDVWRDIGNIIIIYIDNLPAYIEIVIGIETTVSVVNGFSSAITACPLNNSSIFAYANGSLALIDMLSVILHIHNSSIRPFSSNRGRLFRKYIISFLRLANEINADWKSMVIEGTVIIAKLYNEELNKEYWQIFIEYLSDRVLLSEYLEHEINTIIAKKWSVRWPKKQEYDFNRQ